MIGHAHITGWPVGLLAAAALSLPGSASGAEDKEVVKPSLVIKGREKTRPPEEIDHARLDLLVSVLEAHNCRLHQFQLGFDLLSAIEKNNFRQDELRRITDALVQSGRATRHGDVTILNTEKCA